MMKKRGSVLILALWTLSLLTVFAVQLGLTIRQRTTLLSRIEDRSQLRHLAAAGIKKSVASIRYDLHKNGQIYTAVGKEYRHNNPAMFSHSNLNNGFFDVSYSFAPEAGVVPEKRFGFQDEEGKLNINTASRDELLYLFRELLNVDEDSAKVYADAILEWRAYGKTEVKGFYSDDFYASLRYPYQPKSAEFEQLDELLLVRGFTPELYKRVINYITIYGNGLVNINTTTRPVLKALGLSDVVIDKLLLVRNGIDELDSTADDYIFYKTFDIASEVNSFIKLETEEFLAIDKLNRLGKIQTNSSYFRLKCQGHLEHSTEILEVTAVYNTLENKFEYWRENN